MASGTVGLAAPRPEAGSIGMRITFEVAADLLVVALVRSAVDQALMACIAPSVER